jgi:TPR repeat protein
MYRWTTVALLLVPLPTLATAQEPPRAGLGPHLYGKVIVLCIGIENYQSAKIRPADFAANDAKKLGEMLRARYGYTPEYLIDAQATRNAIRDRLKACAARVGSEDVVIVFFAGHGQVINLSENRRAGYLIPYDADLDLDDQRDAARWQLQALDMHLLTEEVSKIEAKHVLLAVDACCSGFLTTRGGLDTRGDLQKLLDNPSRMVLAATTSREKARGSEKLGHGIFTAALLDVLKTNQPLCVTDVLVDVRKRVLRDSAQTMTPAMSRIGKDEGSGELVFLPLGLDREDVRMAVDQARRLARAGKSHLLHDLRERALERANRRTTLKDVIDAFEAPDYRFADDAATKAQEWERRLARLEENAACGEVLAMLAMHYCCANGLGREKDPAAAFRWAKLAFDTGHPGGQHVLGRCLVNAIGTQANERAGLKLIREAAEARTPFPISRLQVAIDLCKAGKYGQADRTLRAAQAEGVNQAAVLLADCYLGIMPGGGFFEDITPDPKGAIEILKPAAEQGNVNAQFLLAHAYAWNRDMDGLRQAGQWLERAAQNGSAAGQSQLARELSGGAYWPVARDLPLKLGLKVDRKRALQYARVAAEQSDPDALVVLACYHQDLRDDEKAQAYCDKAVAKNHPCGMVLKSMWYSEGTIYRQDADEAARWAVRAAASRNPTAMLWLGGLYGDQAIPRKMLQSKDYDLGKPVYMHYALYYFTEAAAKGSPRALENIQEIAQKPSLRPTHTEWKFFERDYPKAAKKFCEMTGFKPPKP